MIIRKDWININWKKYLYISISNPKRTLNKLKGIFKPLKCYFRFSSKNWNPILWCSRPYWIQIIAQDVGWKDKYDTPRYEYAPYIWIHIFKWNFIWYWSLPLHQKYYDDEYWEQALWYLYYNKTISQGLNDYPDIKVAKETWPWQDMKGNSTWTDEFLIK